MQYSLDFKLKALQIADYVGISAAAEKLAIPTDRLYAWRRNRAYLMSLAEQKQQNNDEVAVLLEELKALKHSR